MVEIDKNIKTPNLERHSRHILLKEIGGHGQKQIANAKIAIIGAGGLGAPVALYLAAAGVGNITIIDDDIVELSNLQRQIIFTTNDIGAPKVNAAQERIKSLDGDINVNAINQRLSINNIDEILGNVDIILDGCDNFETRFLINKYAFENGKILISGALGRFDGQVMAFDFKEKSGPCYQCFVPDMPPNAEACSELGVVGAICGITGSIMALEAIKIITNNRDGALLGRILIYDGLNATSRTLMIPQDKACKICGK